MSYPGGKGASGVAQTIINQQPRHTTYVEPFLGGGSVMLSKKPADRNFGIDLDADPVSRFRSMLQGPFSFTHGDGIHYLRKWAPQLESSALIYCDPPYLLATRASYRRLYRCEMTEQDHDLFLRSVLSLECMVQVSGYWSSLYAERLEGWRLVRFASMTRGGPAEECLWMNYAAPIALHDYQYLGENFRERERIKRKVTRWSARLSALPQLEKLAVYSALAAEIDRGGDAGRRTSPDLVVSPAASMVDAMEDLRQ